MLCSLKAFDGSVDKMMPGKSYSTPTLQNLFNGSKLNNVNWGKGGNARSSRTTNSHDNRLTRDIGVQFNAVEFKRSTDELKLHASIEEKMKKTAKKKRKSGLNSQEPVAEHEEEVEMDFTFYESASARKRTATAEEKERALNTTKVFEPPNPFYQVVLRPSYLYRGSIMVSP
ncbi:hypothetical protein RJT34_03341 [Clitoria ternatea]|uniref:Uncharacterized protein n=1 Tax=Clitoria ternatea TaxID=43366 RepID=A0AAN9KM17_CLITE